MAADLAFLSWNRLYKDCNFLIPLLALKYIPIVVGQTERKPVPLGVVGKGTAVGWAGL